MWKNYHTCTGYDVGKRWDDCSKVSKDHLNDYVYSYFDANAMISLLRSNNRQEATQLMENLKQTIQYDDLLLFKDWGKQGTLNSKISTGPWFS
mgnify:CR=1 FL=1